MTIDETRIRAAMYNAKYRCVDRGFLEEEIEEIFDILWEEYIKIKDEEQQSAPISPRTKS